MLLNILRAIFILLMAAVGYASLGVGQAAMFIALAVGILFVLIDIFTPRAKKLSMFSGTFFGLVVGLAIDPRTVTGAPVWMKPAKFAASIAVYGATLTWLLSFVRDRRPVLVAVVSWVTTILLGGELAIIAFQAARGTTSHFNNASPFDAALFSCGKAGPPFPRCDRLPMWSLGAGPSCCPSLAVTPAAQRSRLILEAHSRPRACLSTRVARLASRARDRTPRCPSGTSTHRRNRKISRAPPRAGSPPRSPYRAQSRRSGSSLV
jgi:hypothetical protein